MIILIAESKTMNENEYGVSTEEFSLHTPVGEAGADKIMESIVGLTVAEISERLKISAKMAIKVRTMAYEFRNKLLSIKAVQSFTGVVFRNLSYDTLPERARKDLNEEVRIISSLYGWLKPDDIIKPYRLEYNAQIGPDDKSLYAYWRKDVTVSLVNHLKASGETAILNLLPGDAAKCIDWKLVKNFANVRKVDFKEIIDGTTTRTPNAGRLKALRGQLLREILISGVKTVEELKDLATENLIPIGTPDYPDHLAFATFPA